MEQETLHFEKRVLVLTSRDYSNLAAMHEALASLEEVIQVKSYTQLLQEHAEAWGERWELADVEIKGSDQAQQGIRFNLFQLLQLTMVKTSASILVLKALQGRNMAEQLIGILKPMQFRFIFL